MWSPGSPLALHFKLPVFVETYLKSCLAHFGTDWRQNSWIGICPLLESITRRRVPDQKERRAVPQRWDRSKTRLLQRRMRSAAIHGASIGFYRRAKTDFLATHIVLTCIDAPCQWPFLSFLQRCIFQAAYVRKAEANLQALLWYWFILKLFNLSVSQLQLPESKLLSSDLSKEYCSDSRSFVVLLLSVHPVVTVTAGLSERCRSLAPSTWQHQRDTDVESVWLRPRKHSESNTWQSHFVMTLRWQYVAQICQTCQTCRFLDTMSLTSHVEKIFES